MVKVLNNGNKIFGISKSLSKWREIKMLYLNQLSKN